MSNTLLSIATYAAACGVSRQAIHDRIKSGKISAIQQHNDLFIDILQYPIVKKQKGGRKPAQSQIK